MSILRSSIQNLSPACQLCGGKNEYMTHTLFFCPVARATWYASPLSLRTDALPLTMAQVLELMEDQLLEKHKKIFCNIAWQIWKARNKFMFEGKVPNQREILNQALAMPDTQQGKQKHKPKESGGI